MACAKHITSSSVLKYRKDDICFFSSAATQCFSHKIWLRMFPATCYINLKGIRCPGNSFAERCGFSSMMVKPNFGITKRVQRYHCSLHDKSSFYSKWDKLTSAIAAASTIPFVLLQLPQIILNTRNLMSNNKSALFAVGWLGQLAGLLGNLSLLSYFVKKRETGAFVVQTIGVLSNYTVVLQLAIARAMPSAPFIACSIAVGLGLLLNFLNYYNLLNSGIRRFWEDFITVGGLAVLPQVVWSTFVPFLPQSILPGMFSCTLALIIVFLARIGKLSKKVVQIVDSTSGWTATLLFMWMPIAQLWTSYLNPNNIKGLSLFTLLLAMVGNGLLVPRALFTRDFMWFTGSTWASLLYGWGNILCVYIFGGLNTAYFSAITTALILWLGAIFWTDAKAYGLTSPIASLTQLISGSRK